MTPWTAAHQSSLSITNSWSMLKLMSIESVMSSNYLILCGPFSFCLQSFPASGSSNKLVLSIRWPKYWNFSFRISPSNAYSGLISFRIDWFDLLEVQGPPKSLLQCQNLKASHSVILMVQLSHPYMTIGKTITLAMRTFVSKVMSLLFNRFVIGFFPKSKGL